MKVRHDARRRLGPGTKHGMNVDDLLLLHRIGQARVLLDHVVAPKLAVQRRDELPGPLNLLVCL